MAQEIGDSGLIDTWASSGSIVEPDLTKKAAGWTLGEKPPHEFMNFIQNEIGKQINYMMRAGVPAHNVATPYLAGNYAAQSGSLWVALANNTNSIPSDGNTNWRKIASTVDVDSAISVAAPSGAVMFFARNSAPNGWLKANGAAVSRTGYASLFAAIGTTFGAGNGSTTFNLPDLRSEFPRGWDDGRGVDGGRVFGSSQSQAIQSHSHDVPADIGNNVEPSTRLNSTTNNVATQVVSTSATGGSETRPRNVALLACIKF